MRAPVHNRAALPFLKVTGFRRVGQIDEDYPEVGRILSDSYYLDRGTFLDRLERPAFAKFLRRLGANAAPA